MSMQPSRTAVRAIRGRNAANIVLDDEQRQTASEIAAGAFPRGPRVVRMPRLMMSRRANANSENVTIGAGRLNVPDSVLARYLSGRGFKSDNAIVQLMLATYAEVTP